MTKEKLIDIMKNVFKKNIDTTEDIIVNKINSLPERYIEDESDKYRKEYSIVIWDKESSINGVDASYVLNQYPYTLPGWNGITYLINKGNKTIVIQQDNYETQGWDPILTEEEAMRLAQIHLDGIVEKIVLENIISYIRG